MKTGSLLVSVVVGAIAVGSSIAADRTARGRNVLGTSRMDVLSSNNMIVAAAPYYDAEGDEYRIPEMLGNQLVGGPSFALSDNLLKFDPVNDVYITFWKTLAGVWHQSPQVVETTNTLRPGEAFFIKNKRNSNQVVYLMGEIPDQFTAPTTDVSITSGLQFISYPYPTALGFNDTTLEEDAARGPSFALADNLRTWEATSRVYRTYWLPLGTNGWRKVPDGTDTTDGFWPGAGAFYERRTNQPFVWTESKPYAWP